LITRGVEKWYLVRLITLRPPFDSGPRNKKNSMWFVYILRCEDDSLYTGITTDLERRFREHKSKKGARYTRSHSVVECIYTEECATRSEALIREAAIKKLKREEKLALRNVEK
jgi:putative endonuclease